MKTTDEMILDLVAAGLVLPEGLGHDADGFFLNVVDTWKVSGSAPAILIHDLCAMEFARQARAYPRVDWENWCDCMIQGDSAAAIEALWEGVCDG